MSLNYATGNLITMLTQGYFDIIVHGCNCHNNFGAGIAAEIKERIPEAYQADCEMAKLYPRPRDRLNKFSVGVRYDYPLVCYVVNAYTQVGFSKNGSDVFEYDSFAQILRDLEEWCQPDDRIGFPYIGMGLAHGDKNRIIPMIQKFAENVAKKNVTVTLVEYKKD